MQILKYMLGVMLVLLVTSPSFAYNTLDDLKFDAGKYCFIRGDDTASESGECLKETWGSLKAGMWGVPGLDDKTQVDIIGNSVCVDYRGKQDVGDAADDQSYFDKPSDGGNCFCQMVGPEPSSWMFGDERTDYKECNSYCAELCAKYIMDDASKIRTNMFKTVDYASGDAITTRDYVDGLFGGKQARITQTGTDKLMTFGAGTDAAPGARDIVYTIGTSTSATTVPTVGPIVAAVDLKQNPLSDMANYVLMGTGTAGFVGRKPIYTATNNYDTALVTAGTINTVAAAAANSELTCTRYIDGAPQTDANCLLWGINTTAPAGTLTFMSFNPDVSINGTSQCYRPLKGNTGANGTCGADTLSYLGADKNKSGKWGVVFPYGDISGISVCSAESVFYMGTATDAQNATLDSEYAAAQAGVGESALATNRLGCWCKMENPAASPWMYIGYYDNSSNCAPYCASTCSSRAASNVTFRRGLFGI